MLTPAQRTLLVAAVAADPVLAALPPSTDNAYAIADAFNLPASPAFIVWKTKVAKDEIMQNGFDWVQVDNLSVGKARIWDWLFDNTNKSINPSKPNVRAGIDECWKGTAAMLAVRAAVYVHCKESATRSQKLFATGTGSDAQPATMGKEEDLTFNDVLLALGW